MQFLDFGPPPNSWKAAEECPMPLAPVLEGSKKEQSIVGSREEASTVVQERGRWQDRDASGQTDSRAGSLVKNRMWEEKRGINPECSLTSGLATREARAVSVDGRAGE